MSDELLGARSDAAEPEDTLASSPVDVTPDVDVEDFDFAAFVEGVRPGRRAVQVTMRADLVAELDQILMRFEALDRDDTDGADDLEAEYEATKALLVESRRTFIVEARSEHRGRQIVKRLEKRDVTEPGKNSDDEARREYNETVAVHRLADAIIVPTSVTVKGLNKLREVAPSEVDRLFGAFMEVSTSPLKSVPAVTPGFSQRR